MKKFFGWLIGIILLLMIGAGTLWGLAERYAASTTVPPEVRLSSWAVGGMEIDAFINEYKQKLAALENTPVIFTFGQTEVEPVSTTLKELGVKYDAEALFIALRHLQEGSLLERIQARRNFQKEWKVRFLWNNNVWKQRFTASWEENAFGNPTNASREINAQDQVIYTPDTTVFRLDRVQLEQLIRAAIPNEWSEKKELNIDVPLVKQEATITLESLKAEGIDRKIIEMVTNIAPGDAGRFHNVKAAADTVNEMVLKPGDIFDYDKVIAKAEKQYGFKEAPVILNGKLVPGIGGGICQVSSTLYNAALGTGLEIVERRNHSLPVAYLPLGLDATFSEGYINFRFKNTTGKDILIHTSTDDNRLTIKMFGTMDPSISYKTETKTTKVIEPTIKYVVNNKLADGQQETIQKGKRGYTVESYRIKMVNGKEVSRERLDVDNYRAQPTIIATNSGGQSGKSDAKQENPTPIVEDGLSGPNFR
ncbi:VanW family protein [Paenibacillus marinisediminis]